MAKHELPATAIGTNPNLCSVHWWALDDGVVWVYGSGLGVGATPRQPTDPWLAILGVVHTAVRFEAKYT